jgi:S-DNA-T family DNA segregation ATPase FtsK/SpoIIIE
VSGAGSRRRGKASERLRLLPREWSELGRRRARQLIGFGLAVLVIAMLIALLSYHRADPSWNHATSALPRNLVGRPGALVSDLLWQWLGFGGLIAAATLGVWSARLLALSPPAVSPWRMTALPLLLFFACLALAAALPATKWPVESSAGGILGRTALDTTGAALGRAGLAAPRWLVALGAALLSAAALSLVLGIARQGWLVFFGACWWVLSKLWLAIATLGAAAARGAARATAALRREPDMPARDAAFRAMPVLPSPMIERDPIVSTEAENEPEPPPAEPAAALSRKKTARPPTTIVAPPPRRPAAGKLEEERRQRRLSLDPESFELPPVDLLQKPPRQAALQADEVALAENARYLETVLEDFGIKGKIVKVRPGPVVTLYELEPAPGLKSSRVINLADDIARSMSAVAARVAVIPGRNVIGVELPNSNREIVYLRELVASQQYETAPAALPLVLGKDIGGGPVIADLARMPHLLIAGTTGSGKSVGINTMILSLLYRLPPDRCKFIMVDPKMLELSIYDGIPQLLAPVVTEPKKAIVALRWAVKEMERRYLAMSKLGVRNVDGFNQRVAEIEASGKTLTERLQTGVGESGEPIYEDKPIPLENLPLIVVIVDEMADLMMVAGKDIEAAVQRLAQMARAAGIHLIMATQRPSVDVITGTIKANFPTRVSFQVTSKIDSRTILGEQGAEQLLGQGDMLFMAGGGRITRVHGPFVSETEVAKVVAHLKAQGQPSYLDQVTADEDEDGAFGELGDEEGGEDDGLYRQAVEIVLRDGKASTSFIQRRLQIGYNRAARLVERMEEEGIVSPANHAGKREILGR